jgi:uncharacterized protein
MNKNLLAKIISEHKLDMDGHHGIRHWIRVREIGVALARANGANPEFVRSFAMLHDAKRESEYSDQEHGYRSAKFAIENRKLIDLNDTDFDDLVYAISEHSNGLVSKNVNIGTCWDADRLDLGRVGTMVSPEFLSTKASRDKKLYQWATSLARKF